MSDTTFVNGVTLSDGAGWGQNVNDYIYRSAPKWCGTAGGTANGLTLAPVATDLAITAYLAGQRFEFKAGTTTNTGPVTVNVNSVSTCALQNSGTALVGGDIEANKFYRAIYDGSAFQLERIALASVSTVVNALSTNLALNNISNYFDGPSVSTGPGKWFASGTVTVQDTAGAAGIFAKLWDGTTVIATTKGTIGSVNQIVSLSLSGAITNPAAPIRISVKDVDSTSGALLFNTSGTSTDSLITALRIS